VVIGARLVSPDQDLLLVSRHAQAMFDDEEGWGVINAPEVPGGCFVHFSSVHMAGYRNPAAGARVKFTFEKPPGLQDGYAYRALEVWLQPG
jgi:CspA family cold shock protein